MTVPTDSIAEPRATMPPSNVHGALDRIRRAAQLIATGTLSGTQSRQFATEIEHMIESLLAKNIAPSTRLDARLKRLSARERQVLSALAMGNSVQEVARQFCRSPKTINNQRTSVLRKLELRNTAELTRFAIQEGLVPLSGDSDPPSSSQGRQQQRS